MPVITENFKLEPGTFDSFVPLWKFKLSFKTSEIRDL